MMVFLFVVGFIVGVICTCFGTVKLLQDHSRNGTLLVDKYHIYDVSTL